MGYRLKEVTLRTDNSPAGMAQVGALWADVMSGKVPLLFDSEGEFQSGLSPVSLYHNYDSDAAGRFDLTLQMVEAGFFAEMEAKVAAGAYQKYEASGDELSACAQAAWRLAWSDGLLKRSYAADYESTVPAQYAKDGKCHCWLYIAVE